MNQTGALHSDLECENNTGQGDGIISHFGSETFSNDSCMEGGDNVSPDIRSSLQKISTDLMRDDSSPLRSSTRGRASLRHMHELYETMAEMTVEPISKDEPDVKAFFKALRNHRLQSKLVYVLTVVAIVAISHFVFTVRWLLPYYYSLTTPTLLLLRLYMYWRVKYQYFMLDFCYFANVFWYIYIWVAPEREDVFAVGFAIANGPLLWALLVFRNSLVFHSLDKVTSLYIHLLPSLISYVIRWYPDETSEWWYKAFPQCQLGYSFVWLVFVPFLFLVLHQVLYIVLVNLILKPSEDYMNLYRYITKKESSLMFRLCNLLGPRFRVHLYIVWGLTASLVMLLFIPFWYNVFTAHCVILTILIIVAIYNGATYYIDVFSLEGSGKNKTPSVDAVIDESVKKPSSLKVYGAVVTCASPSDGMITRTVL